MRKNHDTPWTDTEIDKMCELKQRGLSWADIGESLERTPSGCMYKFSVLFGEKTQNVPWPDEKEVDLVRFIDAGNTLVAASEKFDCAVATIKRHYRKRKDIMDGIAREKERRVFIRPTQRVDETKLPPVPPDTRDLTAWLLGDPVPGRRAIDHHAVYGK